jgi:hypothetical protein
MYKGIELASGVTVGIKIPRILSRLIKYRENCKDVPMYRSEERVLEIAANMRMEYENAKSLGEHERLVRYLHFKEYPKIFEKESE